jgi:Transposase DDE domain
MRHSYRSHKVVPESETLRSRLLGPLEAALQSVLSKDKDRRWFPVFSAGAHLASCIAFQIKNLNSMRAVIRHHQTINESQIASLEEPCRSTFSDANNSPRRLRVIRLVFEELTVRYSHLFSRRGTQVKRVMAVDSSLLHCVASAEWATYRKNVNGCKAHLAFDLNAKVPKKLVLTEGRQHDLKCFPRMLERGWTHIVDRAYIDHSLFDDMTERQIFFVSRIKRGAQYVIVRHLKISRRARKAGIREFQEIQLGADSTQMRHTVVLVTQLADDGKEYVFVSNRHDLSPTTIAGLYHARWGIETFFKWAKRTLRMERSLGRSEVGAEMHVLITLILDILLKTLGRRTVSYPSISNDMDVSLRTLEVVRDLLYDRWTEGTRSQLLATFNTT